MKKIYNIIIGGIKGLFRFLWKLLRRHLRAELECFLFWLGGIITIAWIRLMLLDACGKIDPSRQFTWEVTLFYVVSLAFLLGIKGVRRRLNGFMNGNGNGVKNGVLAQPNSDQGQIIPPQSSTIPYPGDQYFGEIWPFILVAITSLIINDYFVPMGDVRILEFFGLNIVKMPSQLIPSVLGSIGLFSMTKVYDFSGITQFLVNKAFPQFPILPPSSILPQPPVPPTVK
ncbi:MAG: hypothetical protein HYW78_00845 [Parcubacteria group bacterium]|nr:hypothetical protein [Parcubacteria group bacterium]